MPRATSHLAWIAAVALLVTALTQVLYVGLGVSGTPFAMALWRIEAVAFLAVAFVGTALVPARPAVGAGLALGGIFNLVQVGMGLVMFAPLSTAGEVQAPAFAAVLSMAFFLYFAGKAAFAIAAMVLGFALWRRANGPARFIGAGAAVFGLLALLANLLAMMSDMRFLWPAGGIGTAATVLLALTLICAPHLTRR